MPVASIIVPAFNVEKTLEETLCALLAQTHSAFEVIVVDDGSSDRTSEIAESFQTDPRVRLVHQDNRGLSGARNTGIARSRGDMVGFCDADDIWEPNKLETHIRHLQANPTVGISYSGSALIDDDSAFIGHCQSPRLMEVDAAHILKRNPIGNGSAPVIRREVFDAIAFRPEHETERDWYFDETFRQSEDIECWLRIALTTDWRFEGVPGLLTRYRINSGGLSANTDRQLASWEKMIIKLTPLDRALFGQHAPVARAYQFRYLARRAVSDFDGVRAFDLARTSFAHSLRPVLEEPTKTLATLGAAALLRLVGPCVVRPLLVKKGVQS